MSQGRSCEPLGCRRARRPSTTRSPTRPRRVLRRSFDARWGGFGGAPKFPQPMTLEFLLRRAVRGSPDALEMVMTTLDRMAGGGIWDHVGGGFARYSTDERWHVPHFEKMLYDNAQLLQLYTRAWQVTGAARYREVAVGSAEYLLREMQHPEGGFFSSQDADSEGVEGKFFTWTWSELVGLVGRAGRPRVRRATRGQLGRDERPLASRVDRVDRLGGGLAPDELDAELADARAVALRGARDQGATCDRRQGARGVERHGDRGDGRGGQSAGRADATSKPPRGRPRSC